MHIDQGQNTDELDAMSSFSQATRHVSPDELQVFRCSIDDQIDALCDDELIQLVRNGQVAINMNSLYQKTFTSRDVRIVFANFGEPLDSVLEDFDLTWISSFLYLHESIYPTSGEEENPLANPRWTDIVTMPRVELISRIHEFMEPMFFDTLQIRFVEFQNEMRKKTTTYH